MIINGQTLDLAFRGFKTVYTDAFDGAQTHWDKIAMTVPSASREETYGWIGAFPQLREWIGPRYVQNLSAHGFTIVNRTFESTVSVKRTDMEDDRLGVFKPMFAEMGTFARRHPEELIFGLLKDGFGALGFDGETFFSETHKVMNGNEETIVSNMGNGTGPAWFLLDTSRAIRPIIWQERTSYEFQSITDGTNTEVFMNDRYVYGVRARVNAGFGLWQLAYGSKGDLTPENYSVARSTMMNYRADGGRVLGINPTALVVPPELELPALKLLNATANDGGSSNVWSGTAELIVTPYVKA